MARRLVETPQFKRGKDVEAYCDGFFERRGYRIEVLSADEERRQKKGDRRLWRGGRAVHVEYKSGLQTYHTGNVFLETISNDATGARGWVYTCHADYIVYAALLNRKLLVFEPETLRAAIPGLLRRFPVRKTGKGQNAGLGRGYDTHGLVVPLAVAESELSVKVIELTRKDPLWPTKP